MPRSAVLDATSLTLSLLASCGEGVGHTLDRVFVGAPALRAVRVYGSFGGCQRPEVGDEDRTKRVIYLLGEGADAVEGCGYTLRGC